MPYKEGLIKAKPYKSLEGLIFGPILVNLGNLDPFFNHVGNVFKHLEQFFDIFAMSHF